MYYMRINKNLVHQVGDQTRLLEGMFTELMVSPAWLFVEFCMLFRMFI